MQNRYTLKTIKELVYKELDEYSKNGEQTGEYGFSKSDLSERLTDALNGAFTRACLSFPPYIKSAELRFFKPQELLYDRNIEISPSDAAKEYALTKGSKLAFSINCAGEGNVSIYSCDGAAKLFSKDISVNDSIFTRTVFFAEKPSDTDVKIRIKAAGSHTFAVKELCVCEADGLPENTSVIMPHGVSFSPLPKDFSSAYEYYVSGKRCPKSRFCENDGIVLSRSSDLCEVTLYYIPKTPHTDKDTPEDYEIELPYITLLGAVYLAAAELCRIGNGELYSRLMYKYRDLALNCYDRRYSPRVRNLFYNGADSGIRGENNVLY